MPRKAITWENCIIYKLWHEDDFYIGSTTDFASRKSNHKSDCNNEKTRNYNSKLYETIRSKGGWDAWQMIPLEEYRDCKNQTEARIREEEWRVKTNANLNIIRAYRSDEVIKELSKLRKEIDKRYREANKDKINEKQRAIYEANKDKIAEKKRAYREANNEKIAEKKRAYYEATKDKRLEYAKEYSELNRAKLAEKSLANYEANKDKINAKRREKYQANKKHTEKNS